MSKQKKYSGKKKDQLLELINQLSSNEQRYFHLYSQLTPNEKNFQKLFKILQGKKTYNPHELKKITDGKMNLPYEKQYLQKILLRSLRNYYSESSPEIHIQECLTDIEILYNHGMREMAWNVIQRAKALAREHELSLHYLLLCNWEHRYLGLSFHADRLETCLQSDFGEERSMMHEYENILDYKFIKFNTLFSIHQRGVIQGKDEALALRQLVTHPLMSSDAKATSFKSKMLFYEIQIQYNMQLNQWKEAKKACVKALELIEKKPNGIRDYAQTYFVMLCNLSNAYIVELNYAQVEETVAKLAGMLENKTLKIPIKLKADIFAYSVERRMVVLCMKRNYKEGAEYGTKIIDEIRKYENILHEGFMGVYNFFMAQFWFHTGKYEKALDYVRPILNENYHSTRRDYLLGAMLTNILIHFELKNNDILGSLTAALKRFCKTKKIQSQFIKQFVIMIKDLAECGENQREIKKVIRHYQAVVHSLESLPLEDVIIGSLDMPNWFQKRL